MPLLPPARADFGLPALVTTAIGETPLAQSIGTITGRAREKLFEGVASALAALSEISPKEVSMPDIGLAQLNR